VEIIGLAEKKGRDSSDRYRRSYLRIDDEVLRVRFKAGDSEVPD
jgi:hypothetical protein